MNINNFKQKFLLLLSLLLSLSSTCLAQGIERSFKISNTNFTIPSGFGPAPDSLTDEGRHESFKKDFLQTHAGVMVTKGNPNNVPKTLQDIIHGSSDAPIDLIQELHEKSYQFWSQFSVENSNVEPILSYTNKQLEMAQIDVFGIKSLNVKAYELWNELVECNGDNPNRARLAFFYSNKKDFCLLKPEKSSEIFDSISHFTLNIQQYLMNNMPFTPTLKERSDLVIFKNPHPLITETVIMFWSVFFNHTFEKKLAHVDSWTEQLLEYSSFSNKINFAEKIRKDHPEIISTIQIELNNSSAILIKSISNILAFLTNANFENLTFSCSIYGLWPALNRTILYSDIPLHYFPSTKFRSMRTALNQKVLQNCGSGPNLLSYDIRTNGVYGLYFNSNVHNIRARYRDFIGVQHDSNIGSSNKSFSIKEIFKNIFN